MIFVGIILVLVAVGCFFGARAQARRLRDISSTETYTAAFVRELHAKVSSTVGGEALAERCEVVGRIACDAPLTGPYSHTTCVAFSRSMTREYEEDVTETNSEGNRETKTSKGTETLESEEQRVNFWVQDASGRVLVCPDDAELDMPETVNRFEPARSPGSSRKRTLGMRYHEQSLALGTQVYVLGYAVDRQGQPAIACSPRTGGQAFIISRRSEKELSKDAASWSMYLRFAAAGSALLGVLLLVIGAIG